MSLFTEIQHFRIVNKQKYPLQLENVFHINEILTIEYEIFGYICIIKTIFYYYTEIFLSLIGIGIANREQILCHR